MEDEESLTDEDTDNGEDTYNSTSEDDSESEFIENDEQEILDEILNSLSINR